MKLTSNMEFDFKLIVPQEGQEGQEEREVMNGDFYILENGEVIGGLTVTSYFGERQVSAETPDINFSIDEWIAFISKVKERFKLDGSQSIMMNRYPQSFAM